jgi:hypothetical protein
LAAKTQRPSAASRISDWAVGRHDAHSAEQHGVRGMRGLHTPETSRKLLDWSALVAGERSNFRCRRRCRSQACQAPPAREPYTPTRGPRGDCSVWLPEALRRRVSLVLVMRMQVHPVSLRERLALRISEQTGTLPVLPPVRRWPEPEWEQVAPGIMRGEISRLIQADGKVPYLPLP